MASGIKIHLYKVAAEKDSLPVSDLLTLIAGDGLANRMRKLNFHQEVRLEDFQHPSVDKPYWLLDFGKMRRDGGPGRASDATPILSFDLEQGEAFAEETAMLFDPAASIVILQYNHHGPRSSSIADYLTLYQSGQANLYEFLLQLKSDAQARLETKKIFTKLVMKVAPAKLSDAFKKNNIALTSMVSNHEKYLGGDHISIEVALDRRSNGSLSVGQWLKSLFKMADEESQAVNALIVSGKEDAGGTVEAVDLINEKVEYRVPSLPLDKGLRHPRIDRWKALEAAYTNWKAKKLF